MVEAWIYEVTKSSSVAHKDNLQLVISEASEFERPVHILLALILTNSSSSQHNVNEASPSTREEEDAIARGIIRPYIEQVRECSGLTAEARIVRNARREYGVVECAKKADAARVYIGKKKKLFCLGDAVARHCISNLTPDRRIVLLAGGRKCKDKSGSAEEIFETLPPRFDNLSGAHAGLPRFVYDLRRRREDAPADSTQSSLDSPRVMEKLSDSSTSGEEDEESRARESSGAAPHEMLNGSPLETRSKTHPSADGRRLSVDYDNSPAIGYVAVLYRQGEEASGKQGPFQSETKVRGERAVERLSAVSPRTVLAPLLDSTLTASSDASASDSSSSSKPSVLVAAVPKSQPASRAASFLKPKVPAIQSKLSSGSRSGCEPLDSRIFTLTQLEHATANFDEANLLGKGAFGSVYRGSLLGSEVAVKKLNVSSKKQASSVEFCTEVQVLSALRHPHLVLLMGYCPGNKLIVYEYMQGGSLRKYLQKRSDRKPPNAESGGDPPEAPSAAAGAALGVLDRFRIATEICAGLAFMHQHSPPIVHRDLKPDNILLDEYRISKVADVGLAKLEARGGKQKPTWSLKGTFGYMDPESLNTGVTNTWSDVYALGIILLQLITGFSSAKELHRVLEDCRSRMSEGAAARLAHGRAASSLDYAPAVDLLMEHLDATAGEWPESATRGALEVMLRCAERKKATRPDLLHVVIPALQSFRKEAEEQSAIKQRSGPNTTELMICPLSKEIMKDPVMACDGFTYERAHIEEWMRTSDVSPVTKLPLEHKFLVQNNALKRHIENLGGGRGGGAEGGGTVVLVR